VLYYLAAVKISFHSVDTHIMMMMMIAHACLRFQ